VIHLAILDGLTEANRADISEWVRRTALAEANYWDGFTAKQMLLAMVPAPNRRGIGFGRTVSGGGATVMVEVGTDLRFTAPVQRLGIGARTYPYGMPYISGRATWFMKRGHLCRADHPRPADGRPRRGVARVDRSDAARRLGLRHRSVQGVGSAELLERCDFHAARDLGLRRATSGAMGWRIVSSARLAGGLIGPMRVDLADYCGGLRTASPARMSFRP